MPHFHARAMTAAVATPNATRGPRARPAAKAPMPESKDLGVALHATRHQALGLSLRVGIVVLVPFGGDERLDFVYRPSLRPRTQSNRLRD